MSLENLLNSAARTRKKYLLTLVGLALVSALVSIGIALMSRSSAKIGTGLTLLAAIAISQLLAFRRLGQTTHLGATWRLLLAFVVEWSLLSWDGDAFLLSVLALHAAALITGRSRDAAAAPAPSTPTAIIEAPSDAASKLDEPHDAVVKRTGWQMPGLQRGPDPLIVPANGSVAGPRFSTMKGSVFGQVRSKEQTTIQAGRSNEPIVTLRIERNDPHAGLSSVAIVRLTGPSAVGFADVGDLVEAVGPKQAAYVQARRCINHSTGATYKLGVNVGAWMLRALVAIAILFMLTTFGPMHSFLEKIGQLSLSWMH